MIRQKTVKCHLINLKVINKVCYLCNFNFVKVHHVNPNRLLAKSKICCQLKAFWMATLSSSEFGSNDNSVLNFCVENKTGKHCSDVPAKWVHTPYEWWSFKYRFRSAEAHFTSNGSFWGKTPICSTSFLFVRSIKSNPCKIPLQDQGSQFEKRNQETILLQCWVLFPD